MSQAIHTLDEQLEGQQQRTAGDGQGEEDLERAVGLAAAVAPDVRDCARVKLRQKGRIAAQGSSNRWLELCGFRIHGRGKETPEPAQSSGACDVDAPRSNKGQMRTNTRPGEGQTSAEQRKKKAQREHLAESA